MCARARGTTEGKRADPALEEDADQTGLWFTTELRYGLGLHTCMSLMRSVTEEEGHASSMSETLHTHVYVVFAHI